MTRSRPYVSEGKDPALPCPACGALATQQLTLPSLSLQADEEADVLRRIVVRLILHDNILLQIGVLFLCGVLWLSSSFAEICMRSYWPCHAAHDR